MDSRERLVRSIDEIAYAYAEHLCDELDGKPFDRSLLRRFAEATPDGPVCDLGCGPGHVTAFLASCRSGGVVGVDLSPQMIAEARRRYPPLDFRVGDMLGLQVETGSLSGVVALYSIIHLRRDELPQALEEMGRVLQPGGLLLIAFHEGAGELHLDEVFDTKASFDLTLFETDEAASLVEEAGFSVAETTLRRPYEAEYPTQRAYIVAEKRGS